MAQETSVVVPAPDRKVGIYEESQKLHRTIMWGPAGIEAAIAQLLPTETSCFLESFDVMKARMEFKLVLELIGEKSPETEIIMVKDEYVRLIEAKGLQSTHTKEEALDLFKAKARDYFDTYVRLAPKDQPKPKDYKKRLDLGAEPREQIISEYKSATKAYDQTRNHPPSEKPLRQVEKWIEQILEEDIEQYGENTALVLNQMLVNGTGLPLANVIYARDQSNVMGNTFVWSKMRHTIRQPEVALYQATLDCAGVTVNSNYDIIHIDGNGRFEGGDGIVMSGIAYIGVGGRTNMEGVKQMAKPLLNQGLRIVVAYHQGRDKNLENEMEVMHLDTFAMPISPTEMVICKDEAQNRQAIEIRQDANGQLTKLQLGTFLQFLQSINIDLIEISKYDQLHFAPNFVNLGNKTVVLSLDNKDLAEKLTARGYKVLTADLNEITKGYGGLHCSMAPIERV